MVQPRSPLILSAVEGLMVQPHSPLILSAVEGLIFNLLTFVLY